MREDIQKVLCTRARIINRDCWNKNPREKYIRNYYKKNRLIYDENGNIEDSNAINKISMHMRGKEFSDLLAPLKGWARKSIGKPYDKAWSELCKHLNGQGVLQNHVKQHARSFIIPPNEIVIIDNRAFYRKTYYRYSMIKGEIESGELYGDPRDGIIKFGKGKFRYGSKYLGLRHKNEKILKKQSEIIKISETQSYQYLNGYWFLITKIPYKIKKRVWNYNKKEYELKEVEEIKTTKKQLSNKELKIAKLKNFNSNW